MAVEMIYGEKRKCVVFNLDKPRDRRLHDKVCGVNFGQLVKNLLEEHFEREERAVTKGD